MACMRRTKRTSCVRCHGDVQQVGGLSTRGLCAACITAAVAEAAAAMAGKSGSSYDRWLASNGPKGRPRR